MHGADDGPGPFMNQEQDHINHYSADDILRYLAGKMSPAEMHALEKAALDDPFLSDAIEGMSLAMREGDRDVTQKLQELKSEFAARTSSRPALVAMRYTRWWKVAAAVIVLIGSSVWTYEVFVRSGQPSYARKETPVVPAPIPSTSQQDTAAAKRQMANDPGDIVQESHQPTSKPDKHTKSITSSVKKADAPASDQSARPGVRSYAIVPRTLSHANDIAMQDDDLQKKKSQEAVLDSEHARRKPVAPAVASRPAEKEVALHDSGNQAYRQPAPSFNEVVVTGYGKAKRRKSALTKVMVQSAQPAVGWEQYLRYIDSSKRVPEANAGLKGEVVLSFIVDKTGIPQNFRIEQSMNSAYDEEAIRLVREGPRWKLLGRRKTRATMIVRF